MEGNLRLSQEDHRNNNIVPDEAPPDNDEHSFESLCSLPFTECYVEDNMLDLTPLHQEYVDPSVGYEFVNTEGGLPSNLDNSDALLRQLAELGVRVPKDYITLDLDASGSRTGSRTASVSTTSEGNSWHDDEDVVFSSLPEELEDEIVQAEILPNGSVKVSYDNLQKNYTVRMSSHKKFHDFLCLVQHQDDEKTQEIEGAASTYKIPSSKEPRKLSSKVDIVTLRKKLASSFAQLKNTRLIYLQEKCSAQIKKLIADEISYDAMTPDSGVSESFNTLTADEQEKQREEWRSDLAKTEDEIQTLRQVLASKVKHAQDLKRRLGITVWREFSDDFSSSLKSVKESQTVQKANEVFEDFTGAVTSAPLVVKANEAFSGFHEAVTSAPLYQKTAGAMGAVTEKTSAIFGGIGAKFGQLKETPTFKSFEERVGSVYTTAKSKVTGSESNSTQDFEEALREAEAEKAAADAANGTVTDTSLVDPSQTAAS